MRRMFASSPSASLKLQLKLNLIRVYELIEALVRALSDMPNRVENSFHEIFSLSDKFSEVIDIELVTTRIASRQTLRANIVSSNTEVLSNCYFIPFLTS